MRRSVGEGRGPQGWLVCWRLCIGEGGAICFGEGGTLELPQLARPLARPLARRLSNHLRHEELERHGALASRETGERMSGLIAVAGGGSRRCGGRRRLGLRRLLLYHPALERTQRA